MALLSKITLPSSTIEGAFAFGFIALYSGVCCSPFLVSTGMASYSNPISSKHKATFIGLGPVL